MRHKTGGRVKGTPNKVTADVRAAIAAFAEANISKLQTWLDAIAAKDPARAAELLLRALEYHVPKLRAPRSSRMHRRSRRPSESYSFRRGSELKSWNTAGSGG